jgi:HAD superfamily hydrolase (TIGR01509 family)
MDAQPAPLTGAASPSNDSTSIDCTATPRTPATPHGTPLPQREDAAAPLELVLWDLDDTILATEDLLDLAMVEVARSFGVELSHEDLHAVRGCVDAGPGSWPEILLNRTALRERGATEQAFHDAT